MTKLFYTAFLLTTLFYVNASLANTNLLSVSGSSITILVDAPDEAITVSDTLTQGGAQSSDKKVKRTIIPGLIYYLLGGFVLVILGLGFMLRRKPKTK